MSIDADSFKDALGNWLSGVTIVTWMCPESCRKASWRKAPADWLTTLPRYAA